MRKYQQKSRVGLLFILTFAK